MSQRERAIAALLLAIAVVGVALIPRLLSAPVTSIGVAIGPGPGRSVVEAPAAPRAPRRATPRLVTPPSQHAAAAGAPAERISLHPAPKPRGVPTKKVPVSVPPTTTTPSTTTPPPTPPPPPPPSFQPPPAPPSPLTPTSTRPGNGYGDKNHVHTGPPGQAPPGQQAPSATPAHRTPPKVTSGQRNRGHDVPGSGHARPLPQVPAHPVGARDRHVGRVAKAPAGAAPPAPEARPQARPQAGRAGGQGSQPAPPVAHGPSGPKGKHS
jgi:hypothetical protein